MVALLKLVPEFALSELSDDGWKLLMTLRMSSRALSQSARLVILPLLRRPVRAVSASSLVNQIDMRRATASTGKMSVAESAMAMVWLAKF